MNTATPSSASKKTERLITYTVSTGTPVLSVRMRTSATGGGGGGYGGPYAGQCGGYPTNGGSATAGAGAGMVASYQARENQPVAEDYMEEARS